MTMVRRCRATTSLALTALALLSLAAATPASSAPTRGATPRTAQLLTWNLGEGEPKLAYDAHPGEGEEVKVAHKAAALGAFAEGVTEWASPDESSALDEAEAETEAKEETPERASSLGRGQWTSAFGDESAYHQVPDADDAGSNAGAGTPPAADDEREEPAEDQTGGSGAGELSEAGGGEGEGEGRGDGAGEEGEEGKQGAKTERPKEPGLGRGRWVSAFDMPLIKRAGNSVGMWGSAFLEKKLVDAYADGAPIDEADEEEHDTASSVYQGDVSSSAPRGGATAPEGYGGRGGYGPGGYPYAGDPNDPNRVVWQRAALGAAAPDTTQVREERDPVNPADPSSRSKPEPEHASAATAVGSEPVFVHIPKTGGVAVELSAARRGVRLGRCAASCDALDASCEAVTAAQAYPVQPGYERCSRVHRPPQFSNGVIPNSFCVVRNPFHRLMSEFAYWRLMPWVKNPAEDSCASFERWVRGVTDNVINNRMMQCHVAEATHDGEALTANGCHGMKEADHAHETPEEAWENCHTLPQSLYTASCETVLSAERWEEDVKPWMAFVAGVPPEDEEVNTASYLGPEDAVVDSRCWVEMKWTTIQKVHRAYVSDFRTFGYATSPYSAPRPRRGITKDVVKRAQLGMRHTPNGGAREVDADGVSRCLKPMRSDVLDAMVNHKFLHRKFGDNLREFVEAGRE